MENDQQEDENGNDIDSLNKAKPTKKQKATNKPKTKPTKKTKPTRVYKILPTTISVKSNPGQPSIVTRAKLQ